MVLPQRRSVQALSECDGSTLEGGEVGVELRNAARPAAMDGEPLNAPPAAAAAAMPAPAVRWRNLAMGMLVILSGGTVYSFGAYSSALKERLALSQEELELAALFSNVGNYIGVAGFFYDRFGARTSVAFGSVLIGAGYGAQWLLMAAGTRTRASAPLLCACCFLWGHGSGYLDVAAIGTNVAAFPAHRGAVVGLLKSLYGLASSLIVLFAAYWTSGTTSVAGRDADRVQRHFNMPRTAVRRGLENLSRRLPCAEIVGLGKFQPT